MINQELVNKIHCLLDKGVTSGIIKDPKPGNMCLEQLISYAFGEEVTDYPSCVGEEVRGFTIMLNDGSWSSPSARAEGMRELSIAQLGSNSLNQKEFRDKLRFAVITKLLPAMFKDLREEKWEKEIKFLEEAKSLEEAIRAAYAASDAVYAAALDTTDFVNHAAHAAHFANAARDAALATKTGDKYLKMVSYLAVEVLKEMGSPGCQFI